MPDPEATPAQEPTEPVVEPVVEPAAEPVVEPAAEPAAEPKAEPKPDEHKEFVLKLEEGSPLSDSDIDRISTLAKEKGLSEGDAKELIAGQEAAVNVYKDAQMQDVEDVRTEWVEESKSDKEFGGEEFDANMAVAKTAIDKYGSAEFKKSLEDTGFGNHPEVIRVFYRIGKAMANDKLITAESTVGNKPSDADILYPTSVEK